MVVTRGRLVIFSCPIFQPILWADKLVLIGIRSLRINTTCLAVLRLGCTNWKIFEIATFDRHYSTSSCWKNSTCAVNHANIFARLSAFLRWSSFSFSFWLKKDFTILVQVKVANLEVKNNFVLSASTKFNKGAEEICEDLLNNIFVQIADEPDRGWVNLYKSALLFVLLK